MAVLLMASFASYSYGQASKIIMAEENIVNGRKRLSATLDNGMEMVFGIDKKAPSEVFVLTCVPCSGQVTIPSRIESNGVVYYVTGIEAAFMDCAGLVSVTIPNSVKYIGDEAFKGCTGLTSIIIPNSVESVGWQAFDGCTGLTSITIPYGVTSIESDAFFRCTGLTSVSIPNSVTSIGQRAFACCTGLINITIPNSVTEINQDAFGGCSHLTSIVIPNSVTHIKPGFGCSAKRIIVDEGNKKYDSRDNSNAVIETATNTLIAACDNTTIPKNVTSIGELAFAGCMDMTSITIPNSVTSIGESAFYGCKNLTSVIIQNPNLQIDFEKVFKGCDNLKRSNVAYQSDNTTSIKTTPQSTASKPTSQSTNTKPATSQAALQPATEFNGEVYQIVEQMPSFPGGDKALSEYISNNLKYPQTAIEKRIQGRVFVGFIVEPDGSISNVKALRGIGNGCNEEAMRVVKSMPKWEPGKQSGQAVRVNYQIPVNFSLPK